MVTIPELYREFEKIDMQFIRDCHEDNGILRSYIENCDDNYLRSFAEHLVRANEIAAENAMGDILYDRRTAEEAEGLLGGGSSDIIPGDEGDVGYSEEGYHQHKESDTFP